MRTDIKLRLMRIGKRQVDLIPELRKRGLKANPSDVSQALSGILRSVKSENILFIAKQLTNEWEREFDERKNIT